MSRILESPGTAEIEIKKSRFIATASIVHSEEDVSDFITGIKKRYYDAKHHCSAYILDTDPCIMHASDDGEPQGTAGRPILSVIEALDLRDVCICVTRYFGGTLLGTGGLQRAYRQAAQECMDASVLKDRIWGSHATACVDYTEYQRLDRYIRERDYRVEDTVYGEKVIVRFIVPREDMDSIKTYISDLTGGRSDIELSEVTQVTV